MLSTFDLMQFDPSAVMMCSPLRFLMDGLHGWILFVFDPKDSRSGFFNAVSLTLLWYCADFEF